MPDGSVVYTGYTSPVSGSGPFVSGVWLSDGATSRQLLIEGETLPGLEPSVTIGAFSSQVKLSDNGQVFAKVTLEGAGIDGSNNDALIQIGSDSKSIIVREGQQAAGMPAGVVWAGGFSHSVDDLGRVAFGAAVSGPGITMKNNRALWKFQAGQANLIIQSGDEPPNLPAGVTATGAFAPFPHSGSGEVFFYAQLNGPGFELNTPSLWRSGGSDYELVAKRGDMLPGAPGDLAIHDFSNTNINNAGDLYLGLQLEGTGIGEEPFDYQSFWQIKDEQYVLIARVGEPAPSPFPGSIYTRVFSGAVNKVGQYAFWGSFEHTSSAGQTQPAAIWTGLHGQTQLAIMSGDQVPGLPEGITLYNEIQYLSINANGVLSFTMKIRGPGVSSQNDESLFARLPNGDLILIAREGDWFDVNPDPAVEDLRQIKYLPSVFGTTGGEDGLDVSLNDANELMFHLAFEDGDQGIFIATVPEPASLAIVGLFAGAHMMNRKRGA